MTQRGSHDISLKVRIKLSHHEQCPDTVVLCLKKSCEIHVHFFYSDRSIKSMDVTNPAGTSVCKNESCNVSGGTTLQINITIGGNLSKVHYVQVSSSYIRTQPVNQNPGSGAGLFQVRIPGWSIFTVNGKKVQTPYHLSKCFRTPLFFSKNFQFP